MHKTVRTALLGSGILVASFALVACSSNPQTPTGQVSHGAREFGNGVAGVASDVAVTTKVKARIAANTGLSSFHIHVTTVNGVVTLTGNVDAGATRDLAAQVAASTSGVDRVINELTVGGR